MQIVIVGLGLNGMLLYHSLKSLGLNVKIVEKLNDKSLQNKFANDNRTIAISRSTKDFLNQLNLWDEIAAKVGVIDYIYTFEKSTKPIVEFAKDEFFDGSLGYVVLAADILRAMYEKINPDDILLSINIEEITQDANFCYIKTQNSTIQANMLFACEGRNSAIAKMLNIKIIQKSYNQKAITFIANHSQNHNNIAVEQFSSIGPFATLPMRKQNQSGFVWSLRSDIADEIYNLTDEKFLYVLNQELLRIKAVGRIEHINDIVSKRSMYPLTISMLTKRVINKINFIGDGLNSIHPVAGQAFNMSVNDIKTIIDHIKHNISLGLDFSVSNLARQSSFDIIKNHIKLNLSTHFIVKLYSNNNPFVKLARTLGLEIFSSSSKLRKLAVNAASFAK